MPTPLEGEDEKKYMGRCMGDSEMNTKHADAKERAAVCYSLWAEAHPSSKEAEFQKKGLPMQLVTLKAMPTMEFDTDMRCDISTITSKSVDAAGDIVNPEGLDWERFYDDGSPVHYAHHSLKVGRALWVKSKGDTIVAKTQYDRAPANWTAGKDWLGDVVFSAVCKGALPGKSLTLLPEEERHPTTDEKALGCKRVIEKATVMEFSVCSRPVNQDAVVAEICKSLDEMNPNIAQELLRQDYLGDVVAAIQQAFAGLPSAGGR